MAYLHPDKLVSVDRILIKKNARRKLGQRRVATINAPRPKLKNYVRKETVQGQGENLIHNLAAHIYAVNYMRKAKARGY